MTVEELSARLGSRYRIERELGRGGMGAVYLARDLRLDRPVALKVLPAEFATVPALRERFLRETRTAAGFSHPNIVPVYAIEDDGDLLAYAMGFIEGETLAERVRRAGPLSVRETVKLLQDVGYALAYAHGRGVVHRDIKPDNIMIERATGRALVMDFGIARAITAPPATRGLTRVGEVVGTPEYMSPEQATGEAVDGRSDLYALGLTAYFALTGSPAMSGDSTGRILARQISETLPPMSTVRPDLPPALAAAIDRCVAKDPNARFPTAESLVETLDGARLATPEIPVALRMFAQELGTLTTVLVISTILTVLLLQVIIQDRFNNVDNMLPLMLLLAVVATRVLQTAGEVRRLGVTGFTPPEIQRGLARVLDERATRRAELRADAGVRRARRRTVLRATVLLILAFVLTLLALSLRVQIAPGAYRSPPVGTVLALLGWALLGTGLVLLVRSPFRVPLSERIFRVLWLGRLGDAALRFAGRKPNQPDARTTSAGPRVATVSSSPSAGESTAAPISVGAEERLAALERRLAALEGRAAK